MRIERHYGQDNPEIDKATQGVSHPLDPGENLRLRVVLDGSVLEIIANGRTNFTSRFYPSSPDNQGVHVIGPTAVKSLDIWELESIW